MPDWRRVLLDRKRGKPVRRLELRAQDGRLLERADTMVQGLKLPTDVTRRAPCKR